MDKKYIWIIIALILAIGVAGYLYWQNIQPKSAVDTAKEASEAVPEISTNPGEEVPEVNPVDRANPFKYINPLK